jgi:hypothetical protein
VSQLGRRVADWSQTLQRASPNLYKDQANKLWKEQLKTLKGKERKKERKRETMIEQLKLLLIPYSSNAGVLTHAQSRQRMAEAHGKKRG